ncbi:BON domain-containing protein [Pseudodesulfovibrio sp.]|nr:BON domain-containing protein [Pseudodesulfovibrio sp.]
MNILKATLIPLIFFLLPGCAALPIGIGLIPGAPSYFSSVIGNGQSVYETAVDERSTEQQMLDAILAGHAQAEFIKNKAIDPSRITAYAYFGKLYLVGEYESQEQLRKVYECVDKVEGKRAVISRLYLKEEKPENNFFEEHAMALEIKAQLLADYEVTSSPIEVEIVQGDIVLLGVIADKAERDRILAHALSTNGVNRVVSYLYHQENAGPEPRILTAELIPPPSAVTPKPASHKPKKRRASQPKKIQKPETPKAVATNAPTPPEVVNGRVLGL